MSRGTTAVLCAVLGLSGALTGLAVGWAVFRDDHEISIDVADGTWAVVAAVVAAAVLLLLDLYSPLRFREAVTWLLVLYLVGGAVVLGDLLISLWAPAQTTPASGTQTSSQSVHLIGTSVTVKNLDPATIRLLLILTSGAAGGVVNALWVFVARTGNASFRERWAWWYIAGPIFGAAAAFGLTLAFGGSLVEFGAQVEADANDVGLLAFIAFIAGLFSKAALDRMSRLIPEPRPRGVRISSTNPTSIPPDKTGNVTVEIHGTGFTDTTKVHLEGNALATTVDGDKITVTLDPSVVGDRPLALEVVAGDHRDAVVIPRS